LRREKVRKRILFSFLGLMLITIFIPHASASWVLVPNGSFESGSVGSVPDQWSMVTGNWDEHGGTTFTNDMQQIDTKYFEGARSMWLHSRVADTDGTRQMRDAWTEAVTEDWINAPSATHVRIFMRDIRSTHSPSWGWCNHIFLLINNVSVAKTYSGGVWYDMLFTHGEFLSWNHYNYTATGADGQSWYAYEYSIPESVDKTHMKIQIVCNAHDWSFYDTSYFSDLEFVVDNVELLLALPPPLSASISPLSASIAVGNSVTFTSTVSGGTTPYSYQWYLDGNPVSGATSVSWTSAPTMSGIYYIYLKVTDSSSNTTQSETARITVASVPVGGYSFPMEGHKSAKPLTPYLTLIAVTAIGFVVIRRKTTRDAK
jgi:hypothetical protein